MIDYIINTLKAVFNNEGIIKDPPKEEPVKPHLQGMTKKELEAYGRTIGIEIDRRHNKKKIIKTLQSSW